MLCTLQNSDVQSVATYIMCDAMNWTTAQMLMHDPDIVNDDTINHILNIATQISTGVPLQYATHKAYFCGNTFYVDNRVLIPRPETEQLVDMAAQKAQGKQLLDIGTGSGCIALSIKKLRPDIEVTAIDISSDALSVAKQNSTTLNLNIKFVQADILNSNNILGTFNTVVSNPPYICNKEKTDMKANVLDHEPHTALFVPDADPLLFYRTITQKCREGLLSKKGLLLFEINENYSTEVMQMMENEGFSNVKRYKDMYDKWRICEGQLL